MSYNTNSVPHSIPGGVVELFGGGNPATSQGNYIFESFTVTRPKVIIERPNQVKGEGDWVDAGFNFQTGSITLQIPKDPTASASNQQWPNFDAATNGDWYFIMNSGFGNEKWVLLQITQNFAFGDYWKSTFEVKKDPRYSS